MRETHLCFNIMRYSEQPVDYGKLLDHPQLKLWQSGVYHPEILGARCINRFMPVAWRMRLGNAWTFKSGVFNTEANGKGTTRNTVDSGFLSESGFGVLLTPASPREVLFIT